MSHTPGNVTVSDTKGISDTYRAIFSCKQNKHVQLYCILHKMVQVLLQDQMVSYWQQEIFLKH